MSPEQKVKHLVLLLAREVRGSIDEGPPISAENVDAAFESLAKQADYADHLETVRGGAVNTWLDAPFSPHYEATSVAAQMPDGSWVGWTYWFGGGKYAEPESVNWLEEAYELNCAETEMWVTKRVFLKG